MASGVRTSFSDLIVELWGEAGRHARAAPGVAALPFDIPIVVDHDDYFVIGDNRGYSQDRGRDPVRPARRGSSSLARCS